jgi:methyltransferase (TIGR00027 family)
MKKVQASSTALGTAAMRAIESEKPAHIRICYDPFARRFTSPLFHFLIKRLSSYGERRTNGGLTFIVCRCRYIDDYLRECLKASISQLVILGAGLDSRAYREDVRQIKVFEVDHPASQASKIKRVNKIFGNAPSNVTYVPIDFDNKTLDKLLAFGFAKSLKTLFIWEGVTYYLSSEAVDLTLSWVRSNSSPGSAIIFDYQYIPDSTSISSKHNLLYSLISRISGEKRAFGMERSSIIDFLTHRGFTNVVEVNAEQLRLLYCISPNKARPFFDTYAIAHAEVS